MDLKQLIRKGASVRPPRILLVGVEGVGKSTFGAQCPAPLFLCSEDGLVGPQFADVASITTTGWPETLQALDALAADTMGYRTLVVDTLDWLEPLCEQHVCKSHGKSSIEDFGFGKGQVIAAEEFRRLLAKLDAVNRAGMIVVALAHSQIKTFSNPVGENYDRYEAKVGKRVSGLVREWCDASLFATFEVRVSKDGAKGKARGGDRRIVYTTHSAGWDAKNRHGLPEVMELDAASILQAMGATAHDVGALVRELDGLIPQLPADLQEKVRASLAGREGDGRHLQALIARAKEVLAN